MSIITAGIDLAKNIFAVHGVDQNGKAVLIKAKAAREDARRKRLMEHRGIDPVAAGAFLSGIVICQDSCHVV